MIRLIKRKICFSSLGLCRNGAGKRIFFYFNEQYLAVKDCLLFNINILYIISNTTVHFGTLWRDSSVSDHFPAVVDKFRHKNNIKNKKNKEKNFHRRLNIWGQAAMKNRKFILIGPSQREIMISQIVQLESSYSESIQSSLHSHSTFYNMTLITTVRNQHYQMVGRISEYVFMRGGHRQNAVLNSVLVNLILLFKTITTEFRATQQNLEQHNRIWDNTMEFGAKEQNLRQHNGI